MRTGKNNRITTDLKQARGCSRPLRLASVCLSISLWAGSAFGWNHLTALTNAVVCPGASVTFSTVASGPTPYKFEWWKNGIVIPGKTNSSLTLSNVTASDAATYSVKLTGGYDCVTNSATLTVRTNVSATPLTNQAVCPGVCVVFATTASGTGPFTYTWRKNGTLLSGQTMNSLTFNSVTATNAGTYSVEVRGACSSVTNSATLTVNIQLSATLLTNVVRCAGDTAVFATIASGAVSGFAWRRNGALIAGQTGSSLNLGNLTTADSGTYSVVVSGACGNSITNAAVLTVNAPVAATALSGLAICQGAGVMLGTVASGTGPFSFSWQRNGVTIPGATTNTFSLAGATPADAGLYSVIVVGFCGNPVTRSATLSVNSTLTVSTAPGGVTTCPGTSASFNVTASGTGLGYQWHRGSSLLPGQTGSSLDLTNVSAADAGAYSVVVSGTCGNSVTNSATLTVNSNVTVATAPGGVTTCPGTSASFNVTASGTGLGYQWHRGSSLLPGQTGSSLDLTNVSAADAGAYSVVVSGTCGNSVTNSATLTVNSNVTVATAPSGVATCPGTSASFNVTASGTGLGYQWYRGSSLLPGQTGSSLNLSNVSAADAGAYSVVVSGTCGNSVTNSATLTVNSNVTVATAPSGVATCPGTSASFNVTAGGTGLGYQWYRGSSLLPGQTGSSLNLTNVSAADAGAYSVVVSGMCGNSVTNSATLTVNSNVIVATAPSGVATCPGTSASFNVTAGGTGLGYQWYRGSSLLPGQTGSSLNLTNVSAADAGAYTVVVSGACGNSVTNSATLTVNSNVTVSTAPSGVATCPGTSASFNVTASSTGLGYQWYRGSSPLAGQTGSSLNLTNVSAADAGAYTVVVSGACGNSLTNTATLTVNSNVAVSTAPGGVTTCPGTSASFNVTASGTGLGYQWYRGSSLLPGQTGSSLNLSNVSAADAGAYTVVVSGACGNSVTNSATLTVNSNVTVSTAPSGVATCPGTSASFNVTASSTGLGYQWYRGSSPLAGQTGSSLNLTNVSAADAGAYSVVVSGTCGNSVTNSATLTVNSNVTVATAPSGVASCPGTSASFNVTASGTGLGYQWYRGSSPLAGQTGSSLNLTNVNAADAGAYSVVVSGACGNSVTNSATLTVNSNVTVSTAPSGVTTCPGTSASFNVTASGTALGYQWYRGSSLLPGQTGSSLNLTNVSAADAGAYSVVVSGTCGNSVTNSATLTVNSNVTVATAPSGVTTCPGTSASFNVTASGTGLGYQWYRGTSLLPGQTGSSLNLTNVSAADAGAYTVVVSGACGNSVTNSATLTVNSNVTVSTAPSGVTTCPGTSASFNVTASGTGLGYQWYRGSSPLAGQTGSSLNLTNVNAADAGAYSVVVSGACGNSVTNSATLTVNSNVTVSTAPSGVTTCPGTSASFNVTASGTGLGYQWYRGSSPLAGQTGSSLNLTNVNAADAGAYSVVVSGACGNSVTNSATLTVNSNVTVSTAPSGVTTCPGTSASFNVTASGTALGYQWYRGSSLLPGQTGSSLNLTNVSAADAGAYSVVVSGACGNSVTNSATLTVNSNVTVSTAPSGVTTCPGTSASFNVTASGTGLGYQWYRGSSPLAGQTGSSLNLTNVSAADAGAYTVVISGTCGNSVTNSATLTVNSNVTVSTAPGGVTTCPGTSASFNVTASGTGLGYQWYRGSSLLPGQTGSSLNLTNVSAADAGAYTVVVSGACGNSVTNSATLTVNSNVTVSTAPGGVTTCPGTSASFNVTASGTGLGYQWYRGSSLLPGQTGSSLNLTNVSAADAGAYTVVVSGACGNSLTNSATLTVNSNVTVSTAPSGVASCPGTSASFNVTASGTGLGYQWYRGSSPLPGQTGSSLNLTNVSAADAGAYTVVVSGACGNSLTNSATLTVNSNVTVSTAPSGVASCPGTSASFNVTASGTGLGYQWYRGTSLLPGQTGSSLNLTNVSAADAGAYSVVASGTCGNSVTNSATLTVNSNVAVSTAPGGVTTCPGTSASFNVTASGTGLGYQWYRGSSLLPEQTGSSLNLSNVSAADAGAYSVVVSGACGNSITNTADLVVQVPTTATPLTSAVRNLGTTISFTTTATGTGPFSYVWKKEGNVIGGVTTATLTLTNLSYADGGTYAIEVSGACNSVTQTAILGINHPPTVSILSPTNGTVFLAPANFTVLADAQDVDGLVTNVEFFEAATNLLGEISHIAPYFINLTNVPPGAYTFTARATDDLGATGVSTPVSISVIPSLPLTVTGPLRLNYQTGFYEQTARLTNTTSFALNAAAVLAYNLPAAWRVQNASFVTNGIPAVLYNLPLAVGAVGEVTLKYFLGAGATTNVLPTLVAVAISSAAPDLNVTGTTVPMARALSLADGSFLINFISSSNAVYYVQYSDNLGVWKTSPHPMVGTGYSMQWIDYGPPATDSLPGGRPSRFYRIIRAL